MRSAGYGGRKISVSVASRRRGTLGCRRKDFLLRLAQGIVPQLRDAIVVNIFHMTASMRFEATSGPNATVRSGFRGSRHLPGLGRSCSTGRRTNGIFVVRELRRERPVLDCTSHDPEVSRPVTGGAGRGRVGSRVLRRDLLEHQQLLELQDQ